MKCITKLTTALVAALAVASTIAWSGPGGGATTEWERGSIHIDDQVALVPCLGETVHFSGDVPFRWHTVTTPSGGTSYHVQLVPQTPDGPLYIGVGEVSGKTYYHQNGSPLSESFHLAAGETLSARIRDVYVADDGDKIIWDAHVHFTTNANGELTAEKESLGWTCLDR